MFLGIDNDHSGNTVVVEEGGKRISSMNSTLEVEFVGEVGRGEFLKRWTRE